MESTETCSFYLTVQTKLNVHIIMNNKDPDKYSTVESLVRCLISLIVCTCMFPLISSLCVDTMLSSFCFLSVEGVHMFTPAFGPFGLLVTVSYSIPVVEALCLLVANQGYFQNYVAVV